MFCVLSIGFNELVMRAIKILIGGVLLALLGVFIHWDPIFVGRMEDPECCDCYLLWYWRA